MEDLKVVLLKEEEFRGLWPKLLPLVRQSELVDFWLPEQVFDNCVKGSMQCFACARDSIELILFTKIVDYQCGMKSLQFVGGMGGELDLYLPHLVDVMGNIARVLCCDMVEVLGRKGWERKLAPLDFEHSYSLFRKVLEKETLQ